MGLKNYYIIYDNSFATYFPGNVVSGKIHFELDSSKKVRSIRVNIKGESNVRWSESRTRRRDGKTEHYTQYFTGHEVYFESSFDLLRAPGGEMQLMPGTYEYPFAVTLPLILPSSFEGEYGHIRYTVKGIIDRPWRFDHEVKTAFSVIAPLDLNSRPQLREPYTREDEKTFCCLCCASGPFTLDATISMTGFAPGQNLTCTINADNSSDVRIDRVSCTLYKKIIYRSTSPSSTKEQRMVISELNLQGIGKNTKKEYLETIVIPPLPPSNLDGCGIIDINYFFKVTADPSGAHTDLDLKFPITIGTVPLWGVQPYGPQMNQSNLPAPSAPPMMSDIAPIPPGWTDNSNFNDPCPPYAPPPSYNESVFGTTNIKDNSDTDYTQGNFNFAPRYPYYDFKQTK